MMFLNFMRRRKCLKEEELSSSSVRGRYKKSVESSNDKYKRRPNEEYGVKEQNVKTGMHKVTSGGSLFNLNDLFEKKRCIPNPLSTLRRSKHQSSNVTQRNEALTSKSRNKDDVQLKNVQKLDLYHSSPSLLGGDLHFKPTNKRTPEDDKYTFSQLETGPEVLKYTNWETFGSLITINFGVDDSEYKLSKKNNDTFDHAKETKGFEEHSDCESDIYEELSMNEDSSNYCDSDSGISSLYETIIKYQALSSNSYNRYCSILPQTIKKNGEELDNNNFFITNLLHKLKVDPRLFYIFQRNYTLVYTSHVFGMKFDVLTKVPAWNKNLVGTRENLAEIKRELFRKVTRQQQFLRGMMTRLKTDKTNADGLLKIIGDSLANGANNKVVKKYNRYIDQSDCLVHLIFGLELKIANISNSGKAMQEEDMWKHKLEEATEMKVMHDEQLNHIVNHLDPMNKLLLRDQIRLKQKYICETRLVNLELYYLDMMLRIIFMY